MNAQFKEKPRRGSRKLSARERVKVDQLVNKVVKEYGKTLKLLGRE